ALLRRLLMMRRDGDRAGELEEVAELVVPELARGDAVPRRLQETLHGDRDAEEDAAPEDEACLETEAAELADLVREAAECREEREERRMEAEVDADDQRADGVEEQSAGDEGGEDEGPIFRKEIRRQWHEIGRAHV